MQDRQQCFPYYLHSEYTLAILLKQILFDPNLAFQH